MLSCDVKGYIGCVGDDWCRRVVVVHDLYSFCLAGALLCEDGLVAAVEAVETDAHDELTHAIDEEGDAEDGEGQGGRVHGIEQHHNAGCHDEQRQNEERPGEGSEVSIADEVRNLTDADEAEENAEDVHEDADEHRRPHEQTGSEGQAANAHDGEDGTEAHALLLLEFLGCALGGKEADEGEDTGEDKQSADDLHQQHCHFSGVADEKETDEEGTQGAEDGTCKHGDE